MLDWHSCQICYPFEIKILLLLLLMETDFVVYFCVCYSKVKKFEKSE